MQDIGGGQPLVSTMMVPRLRDATLGDADLDGDLDVIAGLDGGGPSLLVFPGDGAGGLGPAMSSSLGLAVVDVRVGDHDLDGDLDAMGVTAEGEVFVAGGDGTGGFQTYGVSVSGWNQIPVTAVDVADLDLDGDADLVTLRDDFRVTYLLDDVDLGPQPVTKYTSSPTTLVLTDVDGDDVPDACVGGPTGVLFTHGTGSGSFTISTWVPGAQKPTSLTLADLDLDGRLDLLTTDPAPSAVEVALTSGDAALGAPSFYDGALPARAAATADIDLDEDADLVWLDSTGRVHLGVNPGWGALLHVSNTSLDLPTPTLGAGVDLVDLDGDGRPDLVAHVRSNLKAVHVALAGTHPIQGLLDTAPIATSIASHVSTAAADLDHDGFLDIAVASYSEGVALLRNDGLGGLAETAPLPIDGVIAGRESLALRDVDPDGLVDIVVGVAAFPNVLDGRVEIHRGVAPFQFASPSAVAAGPAPGSLQFADFNQDGADDLAVTNGVLVIGVPLPDTVRTLHGDGAGGFAPASTHVTGARPTLLRVADLDADGDDDLVVSNEADGTLSFVPSIAPGQFGPAEPFAVGPGAVLNVTDLDGDGDLDVIAGERLFWLSTGSSSCGGSFSYAGFGCGGTPQVEAPSLTGVGCPIAGDTFAVELKAELAPYVGLIVMGLGTGSVPAFPGCNAIIAPLTPIAVPLVSFPNKPTQVLPLAVPAGTPPTTFYLQAFLAKPGSLQTPQASNRLGVHIP